MSLPSPHFWFDNLICVIWRPNGLFGWHFDPLPQNNRQEINRRDIWLCNDVFCYFSFILSRFSDNKVSDLWSNRCFFWSSGAARGWRQSIDADLCRTFVIYSVNVNILVEFSLLFFIFWILGLFFFHFFIHLLVNALSWLHFFILFFLLRWLRTLRFLYKPCYL